MFKEAATLEQVDPVWAWAAYDPGGKPDAAQAEHLLAWDIAAAGHLYRRAGFAARRSTLQQAVAEGPQATVDRLLAGGEGSASFYADLERLAEPLLAGGSLENLPAWWLYAMLRTPHPLREKATLFWHGHFATSAAKVNSVRLMYAQNGLLRRNALGSFRRLVEEISKDPAMLLWLDSATNQKRTPNENYGRELMELFTLGIGNYTEGDIKEAARAFTGWEVRDERFRFNPTEHDGGEKTLLGQRGRWDGEDVVRIVLDQPAAARFIARKAFRFFVSEAEELPDVLLEPLARGFRRCDYDFGRLVETLLRSNLFFSTFALHQKIKSPAELGVGLARALEANVNTYALSDALREMGQHLFYPPNVKGWDGGTAWITTTAMIARTNLTPTLLASADGPFAAQHPLRQLVQLNKLSTPEGTLDHLVAVLLAGSVSSDTREELLAMLEQNGKDAAPNLDAVLQCVHAVTALPEFQLC